MPEQFSIAQVTPYAWESKHAVNTYVRELSDELARRGHRVTIIAPSQSQSAVRETRKVVKAAHGRPAALLGGNKPRLLSVGEALSIGRRTTLPIDVAKTIEELMGVARFDFVHVHEPFVPSIAASALRHSRGLNVGSFHLPTERTLSTQVARRVVELFFGRFDARSAAFQITADRMAQFFPAEYRVIEPGTTVVPSRSGGDPSHIVFFDEEERGALRLFLRALRSLPGDLPWRATIWSRQRREPVTRLRSDLRERIMFTSEAEQDQAELAAEADTVVCASLGFDPAPAVLLQAIGAGGVPVAARLPLYEEILAEGECGLLFEPGEFETLAAQLERLLRDRTLRERLARSAVSCRERYSWPRVADEFESLYTEIAARRHVDQSSATLRRRIAKRKLIDVDLHMHTDHSSDCATPVEVLLVAAKQQGLGAIAITDHNEISGALDAQRKADGIKVIVAEEVKTADQGEVIGLFIKRKIARGMSLQETISEIKRQGGLVYVPHPFDRLHSVPDYEHLLDVVDQIDAIEVFNPRVAISSFNEEAVRFAAKYRIAAGAGSDSHVAQGLGSVRIRMRDFDGPDEFLASLREADIIRKPSSLFYVQALKFLQTKATPSSARRAVKRRKVRKAAKRG